MHLRDVATLNINQNKHLFFKSTETCPRRGLQPETKISLKNPQKTLDGPWRKAQSTLLPVCNNGCPATISKNLCKPSRRCSITSSEKRFVNTYRPMADVSCAYFTQHLERHSYLAGKRWDVNPGAFPFKDVAKRLKVRVSTPHCRVT